MNARQQGFNLISLMIGVSLSLLSILAMLSLYRNMIGISVLSLQDSKQDGQIAAGLLTAQRELLNAGFRVPDTVLAADRVVFLSSAVLNGATLSGTRQTMGNNALNGNAIVWMYKTSSTAANYTCEGLLVQNGILSRLQSAASCTAITSQWNSINWSASTLIAAN